LKKENIKEKLGEIYKQNEEKTFSLLQGEKYKLVNGSGRGRKDGFVTIKWVGPFTPAPICKAHQLL
jgi:hypothetical protein